MEYDFKKLGQQNMSTPSKELDTFPAPKHVTAVIFTTDELTNFCPVTAQPDFNTLTIEYAPDKVCVESKSLKLYLWTFREEQIFGEGLASQIAQDIVDALDPFSCKVTLEQGIRGGLQMTAVAEINREDRDE